MALNPELLRYAAEGLDRYTRAQQTKRAFVVAGDPSMTGGMPMDPTMAGGGMPMDPMMGGGGMPPMDPMMMGGGGMPPGMPPGMPMDPAMMEVGAPPMEPPMPQGDPTAGGGGGGGDPLAQLVEKVNAIAQQLDGQGASGKGKSAGPKPDIAAEIAAIRRKQDAIFMLLARLSDQLGLQLPLEEAYRISGDSAQPQQPQSQQSGVKTSMDRDARPQPRSSDDERRMQQKISALLTVRGQRR